MSNDLITFLENTLLFLNNYIIPAIIAVAFLFFIWNLFVYAILKGATVEGHERSRRLMIYGILAFVIMVSIWGILNLFLNVLNVNFNSVESDYMRQRCLETNDPEICNFGDPLNDEINPNWMDDPCFINPSSPGCGINPGTV